MRSRLAMTRSATIDEHPLVRDDVRQGVDGIAGIAEVTGAAGDDVGGPAGAPLQPPDGEGVEQRLVDVVGDDHEQIPVAFGPCVPTRAASEQPYLQRVEL